MINSSYAYSVARCEREIADAKQVVGAPAYLVAMGINDWERERELIEKEAERLAEAGTK